MLRFKIECTPIRETDRAMLVQLTDGVPLWVPKSIGSLEVIPITSIHPSLVATVSADHASSPKRLLNVPLWWWKKNEPT